MMAMIEDEGDGAQPYEPVAEQHEFHDSDRRDSGITSNAAPTKKKSTSRSTIGFRCNDLII